MLDVLIPSKARRKLLTLFMTNPATEFYARQITRTCHESIRAVLLELNNLESAGVLQSRKQGNMKLYKADKACPIFEELKRIIMKTEGIGDALRSAFRKEKKISFAFIYGSFAKGEERERSDIDLMVVGSLPPKELNPLISKQEALLMREINYIIYPEKEFLQRKSGFLDEVIRSKKIWIIGDEDGFKRFVEGRAN